MQKKGRRAYRKKGDMLTTNGNNDEHTRERKRIENLNAENGKCRRRYGYQRSLNTLHWETAKEMITKKKLLNFRRLKRQKLHEDRSAYKKGRNCEMRRKFEYNVPKTQEGHLILPYTE